VSKGDESLAIDLVRAHEDKTYSLCDAMSFVVMARLGITDAIAFDRHFGRVRAIRPVRGWHRPETWRAGRIQHNKKQLEVGSWLLGWKQAVARLTGAG